MEDATEEDRRTYEYFFCSPHAQIADLAMAEIDADIEATWRPCEFGSSVCELKARLSDYIN
jgi:hypothetical protein